MRMHRRAPLALAPLAAGLVVLAAPCRARADDKQACIAASEEAQQLEIDGKLIAARERLLACARPECPGIVRQDCTQWMADVVAALPTVVLGARDASGRDVLAVKVSIDGAPVTDRLDGRPMAVDPGVHVFRYESPVAAAPVDLQVLVRAGEKNRAVTATFGAVQAAHDPDAPAEAGGPQAPEGHAGPPAISWVLGAMAAAALGTALYFEVAQVVDYDHLDSTCRGHCSPDQVNHVATERWIAGVAAGVGALSLAGVAYFFFRRSDAAVRPASVAVDLAASPQGALGVLVGRF
ncbi:MAG TPA: hypothetical protein VIF15_15140 [Polyangiaceae bacterium]|jgi:hypothetical protein